jgi:hypothetical protein
LESLVYFLLNVSIVFKPLRGESEVDEIEVFSGHHEVARLNVSMNAQTSLMHLFNSLEHLDSYAHNLLVSLLATFYF